MSTEPIFQEPEFLETTPEPFTRVKPSTPEFEEMLRFASIDKFMRLCQSFEMVIRVLPTIAYSEPTFYLSKSKEHNVGDVKAPSKLVECVFIDAVSGSYDFGVQAAWYDGKFSSAFIGGQRSGYRPAKMTKLVTFMMSEITRCMTPKELDTLEILKTLEGSDDE
jgi:hypothetical protein